VCTDESNNRKRRELPTGKRDNSEVICPQDRGEVEESESVVDKCSVIKKGSGIS
jgi:hypothetical protein